MSLVRMWLRSDWSEPATRQMLYPLSLNIADKKGDLKDLVRQESRLARFAIEPGLEVEGTRCA